MIPWQTQAQQQCTAPQQKCNVYSCSCVKDCLLSNHTDGLVQSSAVFSVYMVTLELQHLRSSGLSTYSIVVLYTKEYWLLTVNQSLVVLGILAPLPPTSLPLLHAGNLPACLHRCESC